MAHRTFNRSKQLQGKIRSLKISLLLTTVDDNHRISDHKNEIAQSINYPKPTIPPPSV